MSVYDEYSGVSSPIWTAPPLSLEQKGVIIAATTLAFPLLARGGSLGLAIWKTRPAFIYAGLSPRGGGPGHTLTSTAILLDSEGWSNPLLRGYRPSHGY